MVKKDNDIKREKHLQTKLLSDTEFERQLITDLRTRVENLKVTNSSLQRDIRMQEDVISEQKVCLT